MLRPGSGRSRNDIGVFHCRRDCSRINNIISIQEKYEDVFVNSHYAERLVDCFGSEPSYSYDLHVESEEEGFKILNELFDVEVMQQEYRISDDAYSDIVQLPEEVFDIMKRFRANPAEFKTRNVGITKNAKRWLDKEL